MKMYSVLIVDDESYVVNSISALLKCQNQWEMDIYCAYSGEMACSMIHEIRVDLLITDICMSGINGIELMRKVTEVWPECQTLVLTAYDDFSYAYEVIHHDGASYLLKTESDETILREISKLLNRFENRLMLKNYISRENNGLRKMSSELLLGMLHIKHSPREQAELLKMIDSREDAKNLWFVSVFVGGQDIDRNSLFPFFGETLSAEPKLICDCVSDDMYVFIMRTKLSPAAIIGKMELIQEEIEQTEHCGYSIVLSSVYEYNMDLYNVYQAVKHFKSTIEGEMNGFTYYLKKTDNAQREQLPWEKMLNYISTHVQEELTLGKLSQIIRYSPGYISKQFQKNMGMSISEYIAWEKLNRIYELMKNPDTSISAIAETMGFNSRSYFNRYVKRLTGISPNALRQRALSGEEFTKHDVKVQTDS